MKLGLRHIVITEAAITIAGMAIVSCSSSSSSSTVRPTPRAVTQTATFSVPITGNETFSGTEVLTSAQAASNTYEPKIPLTASGLFYDTGSILLTNGNAAGPGSIILGAGNINVHHAATNPNLQPKPIGPAKGCVYGASQDVKYTITSGTGLYKDITSGHGVATVSFRFTLPKLRNGKCNTANNANPLAGTVTFSATGPITRAG
jgi:hypothetical protein